MRIGIVSDTHGLLRPRVLELLQGSDHILHAGDVGSPEILQRLAAVAPLTAVRGNVDLGDELGALPTVGTGLLGDISYRLVHRPEDIDPAWTSQSKLIVYGHSHRPEISWKGGCLLLNPGACGPRRFHLPLTLALLDIEDGRLTPQIRRVDN